MGSSESATTRPKDGEVGQGGRRFLGKRIHLGWGKCEGTGKGR